jgi:hypothetical protein
LEGAEVRALEGIANDDLVSFRDLIFDRKAAIRKGRTKRGDELTIVLDAMKLPAGIVADEVPSKELVHPIQIASVPNFIPHAVGEELVIPFSHSRTPHSKEEPHHSGCGRLCRRGSQARRKLGDLSFARAFVRPGGALEVRHA